MPSRRATVCAVAGSNCINPRALALLTASVSKLLSCRVTEKMKAGSGEVTGTRKGVGQPSGKSISPSIAEPRATHTA